MTGWHTALVVLWGSGIASGIADNIPFTATMVPVIQELAETHGLPRKPPDVCARTRCSRFSTPSSTSSR